MSPTRDFDRFLIDAADEFIQDLVASFSARRPTMALRLVVAGMYLFAALHLVWAAVLPFVRDAVAALLGGGTPAMSASEINAFATNIIIGRIAYHMLFVLAYGLLSFVVRASRRWTRAAGTIVLLADLLSSYLGVQAPRVVPVLVVLPWTAISLSAAISILLWLTALEPDGRASSEPPRSSVSTGRSLSAGAPGSADGFRRSIQG